MTLRYFKLSEFTCKGDNCCGNSNLMDHAFLLEVDELRHRFGRPLVISSGYRCPIHNARVSSTGPHGVHTTGRATDFVVARGDAYRLLKIAMEIGFTGIGLNQKGENRFLHLDNLSNANGQLRPTIWSY